MDVDPKLQTNRVADLGQTVRPSSRAAGVALLTALAVMSVFGMMCAMSGHGFDIFALLYILSGQWEFTRAQWTLAGFLIVLTAILAGLCWWLVSHKVAPKVTGSADRTGRCVCTGDGSWQCRCQGHQAACGENGIPACQGFRSQAHGARLSARP